MNMSGKRRRIGDVPPDPHAADTTASHARPLSAIAAARLRAEATAKGIVTPEVTTEPVSVPSIALAHSPLPEPEEPEESDLDEEPLITRQNLKLCTWRNDDQNILSNTDDELVVKLSKHTTIALIGVFQFKVLRGAIHINGANIGALSFNGQKDQVYTAYVPATHPISKIRGLDNVNHVQFISCEEPRPLANISPLFADIWNVARGSHSFKVITESEADAFARPLSPEASPEDWLRAVEDCALEPSITITIGATSTGKSTFARRLLNRYLTGQGKSARSVPAVCFLDLDPAKPEYTPHGQVSLSVIRTLNLGPNFTHSTTEASSSESKTNDIIIRAHSMPTNLANYAQHYRACAEDLFLAYKSLQAQDAPIPLVINTPGSVYTSDIDLLTALLSRFKPHHVVHLGDVQVIDTDLATRLHTLQTVVSQYRGTFHKIAAAQLPAPMPLRTDVELRAMQMQSYFHLLNNTNANTPKRTKTTTWSHIPLSNLVPWEFCYDETAERMQDFVGFAMYSEPTEPGSLLASLNGAIVQIVESTSSAIPTPYVSLARSKGYRLPYFPASERTGMVEPLDPRSSKVICTALVRGFDMDRRVVQVLVPKIHGSSLYRLAADRTVFVGGCCDPPEWAYTEDAYLASNVVGAKDAMIENVRCTPWVEDRARLDNMGYLNTVRRVRKFQT